MATPFFKGGFKPPNPPPPPKKTKKNNCHLKIFISSTAGPIAIKLDTKNPWVMGTQICPNERLALFQGEYFARKYSQVNDVANVVQLSFLSNSKYLMLRNAANYRTVTSSLNHSN